MKRALGTGLLTVLVWAVLQSAAAAASRCDRACLDRLVDSYLAALVAHDPSQVPIAPGARFVENTIPMKPGEGLWKTATQAPTTFKIYVPDPVAQQVGFLGVMQEDGKPIELALRLKLVDGRITEMEHLIARDLRESSLANLVTPRPGLLAVVPPDERTPRKQMLRIGLSYYDALVEGNGKAAPFADDCERHENGIKTTGMPMEGAPPGSPSLGCAAQLDTKTMSYIKRIEPRRVWIADPVTGLVFGLSQFRHPMKTSFVRIVGVPGVTKRELKGRDGKPIKPFDLPAAHVFKIRDGKIHEIEAMGFMRPYDSKTGWE